jgi:hypothetical protein
MRKCVQRRIAHLIELPRLFLWFLILAAAREGSGGHDGVADDLVYDRADFTHHAGLLSRVIDLDVT